MVAFNFKHDFIPVLRSGDKMRTIRPYGKSGQRVRVGDNIQLYAGMQSKNCEFIAEVVCCGVAEIRISWFYDKGYELSNVQGTVAMEIGGRDFYSLDGCHDGKEEFLELFVGEEDPDDLSPVEYHGFVYCWEGSEINSEPHYRRANKAKQ